MKNSDKVLYVSVILLVLGLGGFEYYRGARSRNLVESDIGFNSLIDCSINVQQGHSYEIKLVAENDQGIPYNLVDVDARILFQGSPIYEKTLTSSEMIGKKASLEFVYKANVKSDGVLAVEGYMSSGNVWKLAIYKDLPPFLNAGPWVFGIIGLVGFLGLIQNKIEF
ncbi:MAG: hypothetical protein NWE89_09105 [Candidatus Bathyarchaeota archaeon]|nr:hypothetical protein [Candidatus Bathyarchaeota archaeon]